MPLWHSSGNILISPPRNCTFFAKCWQHLSFSPIFWGAGFPEPSPPISTEPLQGEGPAMEVATKAMCKPKAAPVKGNVLIQESLHITGSHEGFKQIIQPMRLAKREEPVQACKNIFSHVSFKSETNCSHKGLLLFQPGRLVFFQAKAAQGSNAFFWRQPWDSMMQVQHVSMHLQILKR